jgi:hypothetical protein
LVPRGRAAAEYVVGMALMVVGIRSSLDFVDTRREQSAELDDLRHVIDDAPPGRAIVGVPLSRFVSGVKHPWAGHLAAYYVTIKGLEAGVNYANKMSLPVRYKNGDIPPLPPDSLARGTTHYEPGSDWAKRFDLVLVHATNDPSYRLWAARSREVDLISHRGKWYLYDVRRYLAAKPPPPMRLWPDKPKASDADDDRDEKRDDDSNESPEP